MERNDLVVSHPQRNLTDLRPVGKQKRHSSARTRPRVWRSVFDDLFDPFTTLNAGRIKVFGVD